MIGLFIGIALVAFLVCYTIFDWGGGPYQGDQGFFGVLAIILLILMLICTIGINVSQVQHKGDISTAQKQITIYQDEVKDLLPQLEVVLKSYPGYEGGIMKNIGKNSMIVLPPNLKANETTLALVKEIKEANLNIYNTRIKITEEENALNINANVGRWVTFYTAR